MDSSPELKPEEVETIGSGSVSDSGNVVVKKQPGRPPATPEMKETAAKKARERTRKSNDVNRERLKETLSIKSEVEELKKALSPLLESFSKKEENKEIQQIKEMPPPLVNPEVKPPQPSGPKKLTKEERIKFALFGKY